MAASTLIARLTIPGSKRILPAVCSFVREAALLEGIGERDARQLEQVTEEACLNVIQHALKGSREKYFHVSLENRPAQFVLAIEDQGFPLDWEKMESGEGTGLGMLFMKSFTDQVRFINLGKGGKRIELIKNFSYPSQGNALVQASDYRDDAPEMAPLDIPITFRRMTSDDLGRLEQCMYRVYDYSYKEEVYYPERMKELLDAGLLVSSVGVTPEGEIVAHQGLKKEEKDSRVAEITMGVVDPRFRGRHLFEQIKSFAYTEIRKEGDLYGLFVEAVANHPFSQKANYALGARETGIMLGYVSANRVFRGISEQVQDRTTVVVGYVRLGEEPEQTVYLPLHHAAMIRGIYDHCGLTRAVETATPAEAADLPEQSLVDVKSNTEAGTVFIRVIAYGKDFMRMIRGRLRVLCINRFDCIYLDLPLEDPGTQRFCAALEDLGFFFAALMPNLHHGDSLRLQYLNNVAIDPGKIVVALDFAKELFDYVMMHGNFSQPH